MRRAAALACAALCAVPAAGAGAGVEVTRAPGAQRIEAALDGALVAALAPARGGGLLLLIGPAGEPDGPRRLARLRFEPEPRLETLAEGLGGWIKSLAAIDLGAGPELVAGGLGRLVSLGPLAAPGASGRPLVEHPGVDLRSLATDRLQAGVRVRLAAAEAGALRAWASDGRGGLRLAVEAALPTAIERAPWGLSIASPPVAAAQGATGAAPLWVAGPVAVGRTRLRATIVDGERGGAASEAWAALPGAESVEQSWPAALDGAPVLVVRTQGAARVDLLERQRLRVLPLAADRTRAGSAPSLAVELDSRRWHETEVLLADADADGRQDLIAAFPEGLRGDDLVVQVWRGAGGGRFEPRAARSDLELPAEGWRLVAHADEAGGPGLLAAGAGRLELRRIVAGGRRALAAGAELAAPLPAPPTGVGRVAAGIGSARTRTASRRERPQVEPLGAAELDERPGPEALAVVTGEAGDDRLVVVRRD